MAKRMPDLFGSGEIRVLRLETAAGLLSLAVVVLICMLLWQKLSGLPVCYGTVEVAPGLIVPNEVPESHVRALSEQIALVLYNNTWETAEASHKRVAQLLHPQLLGVFTVRMEHERALMKEHNLSTQLSIRNTVVGKSGSVYGGHVDAVRRVFAGTLPIRDEELAVSVRFQRVQPSPINPWGLSLIGLEFSQPLRAETG